MYAKKTVSVLVLVIVTLTYAFTGGDGTAANPYQISTRADLEAVNTNLEAHYILLNDIDLTGTTYTKAVIAYHTNTDPYPWFFNGSLFAGTLDGKGFAVKNLTITGVANNFVGLFGMIGSRVIVKNLAITDCKISGSYYAGGLAGTNYGSIINCYSTGEVSGTNYYIGGLAGNNYGDISNCYSMGEVSGTSYYVGGLVGWNDSGRISTNGIISNCYAIGTVSGADGYAGGLVGWNDSGTILNCYSTGQVSGRYAAGGLVGWNQSGVVFNCYCTGQVSGEYRIGGLAGENSGIIGNCYSTGQVNGTSNSVGGLVGHTSRAIANCFWDKTTSGVNVSAGGAGKTTEQMRLPCTFTGWNDGSWTINEGIDYPRLSWENSSGNSIATDFPPAAYSGEGTPESPFVIASPDDLISMTRRIPDWSKYFILANNIDMSNHEYSPMPVFNGNFDGNGFAIENLSINSAVIGRTYQLGLFGELTGSVSNLGLENINIEGVAYIGALAGYSYSGRISNCYSTGWVSGVDSYSGGLVGYNYYGIMNNCYFGGQVDGTSNGSGGLVGYTNKGSISNCFCIGEVSGNENTGGLAGGNSSGDITNCYAIATVTGNNAGGLIGIAYNSEITNCYATGNVNAEQCGGGLVGITANGEITNCYATGNINVCQYGGGLVGSNSAMISKSYAMGSVNGEKNIGGLIGFGEVVEIIACFWDTEASGQAASAGGIGKTTAQMQMESTFIDAGWDFVNESGNGLGDVWYMPEGSYPQLYWQAAKGDLNYDNVIDDLDLGVIIYQWLGASTETNRLSSDINGDGVVDFLDYVTLALQWL